MFTRNSSTSTKTMMNAHLILMLFNRVAASLYTKKGKDKLYISASSLTGKTQHFDALHTIYTFAHTQVFKIHEKYVKLIYAFGSAHEKIGV